MRHLLPMLLAWPAVSFACTCGSWMPFADAQEAAPVLVHARVLAYGDFNGDSPGSMTIEVMTPLRNAKAGERIKVWGDPGNLCRPYVSSFARGSEWIFALGGDRRSPPRQQGGKPREIAIGGCGAHWLSVRDGKVIGELHRPRARDEMALPDFLKRYGAPR